MDIAAVNQYIPILNSSLESFHLIGTPPKSIISSPLHPVPVLSPATPNYVPQVLPTPQSPLQVAEPFIEPQRVVPPNVSKKPLKLNYAPQFDAPLESSQDDDAFETEYGDELSFLVENSCVVEQEKPQLFMPYIY